MATEENKEYVEQLKAELQAAKAEAQAAAKAKAEAEAKAKEAEEAAQKATNALDRSGAPAPIKGSYKGYSFDDGHRRVRTVTGEVCDTEKLLAAAKDGDAEAKGILDWLIKIEYQHFTKGKK